MNSERSRKKKKKRVIKPFGAYQIIAYYLPARTGYGLNITQIMRSGGGGATLVSVEIR